MGHVLRTRIGFAASIVVLQYGCRSSQCATFDEVVVTNTHLAPPGAVEVVRNAISEFARWTGRDGVCVTEVRFVENLETHETDIAGLYKGDLIQLDVADVADFRATTHHELCHAIDFNESLVVGSAQDLFQSPSGWEDVGPRERFARACERGPHAVSMSLSLSNCASPDLASVFLRAEVFLGTWNLEYTWDQIPTSIRDIPDQRLEGAPVAGSVPGLDGVFLLQEETLSSSQTVLRIVHLPVDAALDARVIHGPTVESDSSWHLLGGDRDAPLLVVVGDDQAEAWQVQAASGELAQVAFPSVSSLSDGFLAGGFVWFHGSFSGEERSWYRLDLASQTHTRWNMPQLDGSWAAFRAGGSQIASPWFGASGEQFLVVYDMGSEDWRVFDWPESLVPILAAPVDERVVVRWAATSGAASYSELVGGFGIVEQDSASWHLDDAVCSSNRTGYSGNLMVVDEAPVFLEWAESVGDHRLITIP